MVSVIDRIDKLDWERIPEIVTQLRESVYPAIAPVANQWMEELDLNTRFPDTHREMIYGR